MCVCVCLLYNVVVIEGSVLFRVHPFFCSMAGIMTASVKVCVYIRVGHDKVSGINVLELNLLML